MSTPLDTAQSETPSCSTTAIAWPVWVVAAASVVVGAWGYVRWFEPTCNPPSNAFLLVLSLLVLPTLEEAAFRGGIQTIILARYGKDRAVLGISLANAIASLAFALAHVLMGAPVNFLVIVPSLALGYVFERCGHLWPCIVLHIGFSAVYLGFCALL